MEETGEMTRQASGGQEQPAELPPEKTTKKKWDWKRVERANLVAGIIAPILAAVALVLPTGGQVDVEQNEGPVIAVQGNENQINILDSGEDAGEEETQAAAFTLEGKSDSEILAASADLIQQDEGETAEQILTELIDRGVSNSKMRAASYYNRGLCRFQRGQYNAAAEDFKNALSVVKFPEAYYALGVVYAAAEENYEEAIVCFNAALELEEKPDYLLARAAAYQALGDDAAAEEDYQAVLALDADNETALEALKLKKS